MTWGGLDEIFNPGIKHLHDELERQRVEAKIPGNEAGGGRDSVDLERGIVRITRAVRQASPPQDAVGDAPDDAPESAPASPQDSRGDSPQDAPQDS